MEIQDKRLCEKSARVQEEFIVTETTIVYEDGEAQPARPLHVRERGESTMLRRSLWLCARSP